MNQDWFSCIHEKNSSYIKKVPDQRAYFDHYTPRSLKQQSADKHVVPLEHIILIPNQPVFVLSP
jgi:hypothetical protein